MTFAFCIATLVETHEWFVDKYEDVAKFMSTVYTTLSFQRGYLNWLGNENENVLLLDVKIVVGVTLRVTVEVLAIWEGIIVT